MSSRLSVGESHEGESGCEHHRADGLACISFRSVGEMSGSTYKIPIRAMAGDSNVRGGTIDEMVAISMDSIVGTLDEIHGERWRLWLLWLMVWAVVVIFCGGGREYWVGRCLYMKVALVAHHCCRLMT